MAEEKTSVTGKLAEILPWLVSVQTGIMLAGIPWAMQIETAVSGLDIKMQSVIHRQETMQDFRDRVTRLEEWRRSREK